MLRWSHGWLIVSQLRPACSRQRTFLWLVVTLAAWQLPEPVLLVAGAYYACGKIIAGLLDQGGHLISRLKKNACAYTVPPAPRRAGRGRPRLYGTKIRLRDLFTGPLATMPSPEVRSFHFL